MNDTLLRNAIEHRCKKHKSNMESVCFFKSKFIPQLNLKFIILTFCCCCYIRARKYIPSRGNSIKPDESGLNKKPLHLIVYGRITPSHDFHLKFFASFQKPVPYIYKCLFDAYLIAAYSTINKAPNRKYRDLKINI